VFLSWFWFGVETKASSVGDARAAIWEDVR
jgi:hypothetical protein